MIISAPIQSDRNNGNDDPPKLPTSQDEDPPTGDRNKIKSKSKAKDTIGDRKSEEQFPDDVAIVDNTAIGFVNQTAPTNLPIGSTTVLITAHITAPISKPTVPAMSTNPTTTDRTTTTTAQAITIMTKAMTVAHVATALDTTTAIDMTTVSVTTFLEMTAHIMMAPTIAHPAIAPKRT